MEKLNYYNIYGLIVSSPLVLSNWNEVSLRETVDFTIEMRSFNERYLRNKEGTLVKPFSHVSPKHYFLDIDGVAKYLVKKKVIWIDMYANSSIKDVVLFFEENVLSVCLQLNNIFLFEASAIRTSEGISLICGKTNSGKSTLLAGLLDEEHKFISDDKCLVYLDDKTKTWYAFPYINRVHLWKEKNAKYSKKKMNSPVKVRPDIKKYEFTIKDNYIGDAGKIINIILLNISNDSKDQEFTYKEVSGISKINSLKAHTHLYHLTKNLGKAKEHFQFISRVAKQTKIFFFTRNKLRTFDETLKYFKDEDILSKT